MQYASWAFINCAATLTTNLDLNMTDVELMQNTDLEGLHLCWISEDFPTPLD